ARYLYPALTTMHYPVEQMARCAAQLAIQLYQGITPPPSSNHFINIVYFDLDKYDIRSDFAAMLDAHANFLRSNPSYKVTVEGHAD
ncbi:hypothetical protein ONJ17_25515, partial [Salmonella enterica subsp. enterica serovar Agona]|nr:hypothetical protein [Salmonella enterica subsp. enterica serovar Agona]